MSNLCVVGNCSVDLTIDCHDSLIGNYELKRGESNNALFSSKYKEAFNEILSNFEPLVSFGGAAGNISNAYSALGGDVTLVGKVGNDELGNSFIEDVSKTRCNSKILLSEEHPTSQILVLVDPSKDRTFIIEPGANAHIDVPDTKDHEYFCIDGHALEYPQTRDSVLSEIEKRIERAQKSVIAAADVSVVENNLETLKSFFKFQELFMFVFSEAELVAFYKKDIEDAIAELCDDGISSVVTLGEKGSVVILNGESVFVEAEIIPKDKVQNFVGAGDAFLGGFLFGLIEQNLDMTEAAKVGNATAAKAIQTVGARAART